MATSYTTNLGLALPVTGELQGSWGGVINDEITSLLDSAVAGTTTLSSDSDVTLTDTDGAANQSRQAILLWTANGTVTRTITAPARTKAYIVINATAGTQSIKLVGAGPTTGITLVAGEKCVAAWNGSDFVKVASSVVDGVSTISFGTTGLTPSTATAGAVTVAGTLAVANGGTGQTTVQAAINALAGAVTSGQYLRGNGANVVMSAIQAADVPTLNQNTTGTASNVTGTVAIANGGTGQTTATAAFDALAPTTTKGDLIVSNGSDNVRLAVGTNDYVLTADSTAATGLAWKASSGGSSALTIDNKTAAYTVVAGDLGKIINCTSGSFTVSLTAAATLGAGFNCWVWNTSATATDAITIDPNGTETVDGRSTLILRCGEGLQIICDGTNWQTGDKKAMRGYAENISNILSKPTASGSGSIAIGAASTASGSSALTLGLSTTASSDYSSAIGRNSGATGSQAITGAGAMALGGSYASGTDSFAAAIANNTSSYGATGANSVAIGGANKASGSSSCSVGGSSNIASGGYSLIIGGNSNTASGTYSIVIGGYGNTATQIYSIAYGADANSSIQGKEAYAFGMFGSTGDGQTGRIVLRRATTDATATVLTSGESTPGTTNQVILPNNSTYTFRVQVVGMQQAAGGTNTAGYTFEGVIRRGANAAATVLKNSTKTVLHEDDTAWDCNVSADTTNGGLAVTVTGAAATNIRWVAVATTAEVTYA